MTEWLSNVFTVQTLFQFSFIGSCWSVGYGIQHKRYARAGLSVGIAIMLLVIIIGKPQINIQNDINTNNHFHQFYEDMVKDR